MSFKRWLILLFIYLIFMLAGAVMFLYLEMTYENVEIVDLQDLKLHVREVLDGLGNESRGEVEALIDDLGNDCGHDYLTLAEDYPRTWTIWNSFFFTFTVITTIGFGHMAPKTPWGRVACILYAFIGVPLNGILVASLAEIFSSKVMHWDVRQWAARYKSWVTVLVDAIVFLVPGLLVFLVIPSFVVMAVEKDWSYLDAFYFSFITLTTIGFGDHVAGQQERDYIWVWVYKIVMVAWIIFGLGYIIMIITFVQKALKSKRILALERKMAKALKKHVVGVHNDLGAVRRAINSSNRVCPEDLEVTRKRDLSSSRDPRKTANSANKEPMNGLRKSTRLKSASESDLSMLHSPRRQELEGMNAMLDFIERLLHHQQTRTLSSMNQLLYHHEHCHADATDEDSNITGGSGGIADLANGCDNCGFETDTGDMDGLGDITRVEEEKNICRSRKSGVPVDISMVEEGNNLSCNGKMTTLEDIEGLEKVLTPFRRKGNAEEMLYMLLMARRRSDNASNSSPSTPQSPPPSYNSIATPQDTHSPHHQTLTLLSNLFHRHRGSHDLLPNSTPLSSPLPLLPAAPPPPTPHKEEGKELTKM